MSEQKPREWWVLRWSEDWLMNSEEEAKDLFEDFNAKEIVHVVEYSALAQAEARIKELEAQAVSDEQKPREKFEIDVSELDFVISVVAEARIKELEARNAILVEALAKFKREMKE